MIIKYTLKQAATVIALLILLSVIIPLDLSNSTIIKSVVAQNTNSTLSIPPVPPSFEQLSAQEIAASTNKTCTLTPSLIEVEGTPQQTQGPYFVDSVPNRSDIRSDTSDGSVQEGIPLHLIINVYNVDENDCSCTLLRVHK
jgi:hypothetical protein